MPIMRRDVIPLHHHKDQGQTTAEVMETTLDDSAMHTIAALHTENHLAERWSNDIPEDSRIKSGPILIFH